MTHRTQLKTPIDEFSHYDHLFNNSQTDSYIMSSHITPPGILLHSDTEWPR